MVNNSNPNDYDGRQVKNKAQDIDVVRATVEAVLPEAHAVRVNPRGDNAPFVAPVLTHQYGSHTLPQEGERVIVLYLAENVGVCLGAVYLLDGIQPPDTTEGSIRIGNSIGSHMTIHDDGHITISTDNAERVDIDHQSAAAYLDSDFVVSGDDTYQQVPFDTVEDNNEGIFRPSSNDMKVKADGLHKIFASVEVQAAGQQNQFAMAIFINGVERKRVSRQSAVNEALTVEISTSKRLDSGDVVDVRIRQDSGSNKTVTGSAVTTEFDIRRAGI